MNAELVCSCGLLLEHAGTKLLIDAPNCAFPPFYALSDEAAERLLADTELRGLLFTHLHPDHYDGARVKRFLSGSKPPVCFLPDESTPPRLEMDIGSFHIEAARLAHTPAPQFAALVHYVLLITAGGRTVYIAADAEPNADRHRAILDGRRVDAAFFNSQCLSYPEMRALLSSCTGETFLYHMPADAADSSGIRRKCARNLSRFGAEVPNVRVLTQYPSLLQI